MIGLGVFLIAAAFVVVCVLVNICTYLAQRDGYEAGYQDGLADGSFLDTNYKVEVSDVIPPAPPEASSGST